MSPSHNLASPFRGLHFLVQDLGEAAILARVVRAGLCGRGPLRRDLKTEGSHIWVYGKNVPGRGKSQWGALRCVAGAQEARGQQALR